MSDRQKTCQLLRPGPAAFLYSVAKWRHSSRLSGKPIRHTNPHYCLLLFPSSLIPPSFPLFCSVGSISQWDRLQQPALHPDFQAFPHLHPYQSRPQQQAEGTLTSLALLALFSVFSWSCWALNSEFTRCPPLCLQDLYLPLSLDDDDSLGESM